MCIIECNKNNILVIIHLYFTASTITFISVKRWQGRPVCDVGLHFRHYTLTSAVWNNNRLYIANPFALIKKKKHRQTLFGEMRIIIACPKWPDNKMYIVDYYCGDSHYYCVYFYFYCVIFEQLTWRIKYIFFPYFFIFFLWCEGDMHQVIM